MKYGENDIGNNHGESIGDNTIIMMMVFMKIMVIMTVVMKEVIMRLYYSTIMSFYHIRSRERAKYEAVIHRSVLVKPVYNRANTGGCKRSNYG